MKILIAALAALSLAACDPPQPPAPQDPDNIRHVQDERACKAQPELPWCGQ